MKVQFVLPMVVIAATGLAGCGRPSDSSFSPNREKVGPLIPEARKEVARILEEDFGTPNKLIAWEKFPIDYGKADPTADDQHAERREPGWRLVEGRNLYMTHCLHCHGVSGDGNGPTAKFLNPRPRDYRLGVFKFKSTQRAIKPSRQDLLHILQQGIPGTYMPSFVLLGEEKLLLIVDYVRWLSIRGNMEIRMAEELAALAATENDIAQALADDETKKLTRADAVADVVKSIKDDFPAQIEDIAAALAEAWAAAELPESVVVPKVKRTPPTKESIDKGHELFLSKIEGKKTECLECHGVRGRGDGGNTEKFWPIPNSKPERKYSVPGLHDDWGHPQQPRDLTRGIYRGGRRPIDIFRRVHEGIPGTQMAGFANVLKDEEIWDVVNFVLSIPFDGKHSAYPTELAEGGQTDEKQKVAASEK